jgi:hypothetical protein
MKFPIAESIKTEHEELHAKLAGFRTAGGRTGEAAKVVADVLHSHFIREEEIAMPPLALLRALADDKLSPEMSEVLSMTDTLETELPHMLEQHRTIVNALEQLASVAGEEGRLEAVRFAEELILHARSEEEVLYPAAILVGRYLKLKLRN